MNVKVFSNVKKKKKKMIWRNMAPINFTSTSNQAQKKDPKNNTS